MSSNNNLSASTSSGNTTITPKGSPSMTNGRFASLSPSKPGGLVRRPSMTRQGTATSSSTTPAGKNAEKRRSLVNGAGAPAVDAVKSPGELTVFVDKLLSDLEGKFDIMSHDLLDRMNQMSDRIDHIESAIHEIISTDLDDPHPIRHSSTNHSATNSDVGDKTNASDRGQAGQKSTGSEGDQSLLLAEPPAGMMSGSSGSP